MAEVNPLWHLPALTPAEALAEVQSARTRWLAGETTLKVPRITLHVSGSLPLQGELVAYKPATSSHPGAVLISLEQHDVAYIPLDRVSGVTVHATPQTLYLLGKGAVLEPVENAPGLLELKRRMQDAGKEIGEYIGKTIEVTANWDALPDTPQARGRMDAALRELKLMFKLLADETEGKKALAEKVKNITFAIGDEAKLMLSVGKLTVQGKALSSGDMQFVQQPQLKVQLEKLL